MACPRRFGSVSPWPAYSALFAGRRERLWTSEVALEAGARRLRARIESGQGEGLTDIAEAPRCGREGQPNSEGALPEVGDAIEPTRRFTQRRIVIDVITEGRDNPFNLLVQPVQMRGHALPNGGERHVKPIGLLYAQGLLGGRNTLKSRRVHDMKNNTRSG